MERARHRAEIEAIRLSHDRAAAIGVRVLWDAMAIGVTYVICMRSADVWWQAHWWVACSAVGGLLFVCEVLWLSYVAMLEAIEYRAVEQA